MVCTSSIISCQQLRLDVFMDLYDDVHQTPWIMSTPQEILELAVDKRNVERTQVILAVQEIERNEKKEDL